MALRLGVLASTNATDLQAVILAIQKKKLDAHIAILIANKECGAIEQAKKHAIPYTIITPKKDQTRDAYDKELAALLDKNKVDLVLMIGWMRIVSPWFVQHYKNRAMNIHPSLLPAFAGGMDLNVHEEVLKRGCKITGATLMFIDEGADTGPIISQKAVPVETKDTPDTIKAKVQAAEQALLVEGIIAFAQKRISVSGTHVLVKK